MKKLLVLLVSAFCLISFNVFAQDAEEPAKEAPAVEKPAIDQYTAKIFAQAEEQVTNKDYSQALQTLSQVMRRYRKDKPAPAIQEKLDAIRKTINDAVAPELKEAETALANDPVKGIILLQGILKYRGTETATSAQKILNEFQKNNENKKHFTEAQAQGELNRALALVEEKNFVNAISSLKNMQRRYSQTEAGKSAAAKLEELEKNDECQAALKAKYEKEKQDALASSYYNLATTLSRYEQQDEAVKFLKIVCENYKESRSAKQAENMLKKLTEPKEEPAPAKEAQPAE